MIYPLLLTIISTVLLYVQYSVLLENKNLLYSVPDSLDVMKSKKLVSMTGDQLRSKSTATITRSDGECRQDSTHFLNNSSTSSLIPNVSNLVSPPLALFLKPTSQSRNSQSDASQRTYDFDVDLHNLENLEAEITARSESHRRETSLQGRVHFWIPAGTFDHVQQSNQDQVRRFLMQVPH